MVREPPMRRFKGRGPQTKNVAFTSESSVSINDNGTCFPGSRSPETEEYHKKTYKASIKQRLMERLAGLIIENQATEPGQLALLPHEYWPLPHRRDRVMALPADMTLIALDRQQWHRLLLLPPVGSTPPYSIHQQPLYRPPTTPSITPFLTDH